MDLVEGFGNIHPPPQKKKKIPTNKSLPIDGRGSCTLNGSGTVIISMICFGRSFHPKQEFILLYK